MNISKIEKLLEKYNKDAIKHGFNLISVDYEKRKILGDYIPLEKEYSGFIGFFKDLRQAGLNEHMKDEYNRIKRELLK